MHQRLRTNSPLLGLILRTGIVALVAGPLLVAPGAAPVGAVSQPVPSAPVVRLPFPQDDGSLTPYTFQLGYPLMTLVYDTLFWRDPDGIPQPWLASSVDLDRAGTRVTIHLVDGVRWHDGTPLTADDVAFTFRYVAEHPHPRFTPELEAVTGAEATDASTVVVSLRHPAQGFLDQPLADMPILPAHLWRDLPSNQRAPTGLPVGSGPYRLVGHQPGESYRFEANAGYFRGPPRVSTVDVPIIGDGDAIFARFRVGALDMVPFSLPQELATAVDRLGVRIVRGPSYSGTAVLFNLRRPPFDRPELRRALARALHLPQIADAIGEATPADRGYLHPESLWASSEVLATFDESEARAAVASIEPPPVELLVAGNDPVKAEAAHQVALAWSRIGLTVDVKTLTREQIGKAVGEDGSEPTFQAAITTTSPLASHDPAFLGRVFGGGAAEETFDLSGYRSTAFDEVMSRITSSPDKANRRAAVDQALRLLATDVPVVPLFFSTGVFAYRPTAFEGWVFVKGSGILDKRSFVEPPAAGATSPGANPPGASPASIPDAGGAFPWAILAVVAMAIALIGGATAVLRRR